MKASEPRVIERFLLAALIASWVGSIALAVSWIVDLILEVW